MYAEIKFRKNPLWAALLLAGLSSQSWALLPSDAPADINLYIPGSQANDPNFGFPINNAVVVNALCLDKALDPGTTTHVYFYNTAAPTDASKADNNSNSAIFCYTDNTKIPGLAGGTGANNKQKLLISRRRLGASFVGLDAVQNGTQLTYLSTNDIQNNCKPATANSTAGGLKAFNSAGVNYNYDYSCSSVTAGITATAATSDISPDVFRGGDNVVPGYNDIDPTSISNIYTLGGHIIGVPVTLQLRNALQLAESQSGLIPASCTPGTETPACVPTLTKAQLVSLFSGTTSKWSDFYVNGTDLVTLAKNYSNQTLVKAPSDSLVHICRRENGAGQQVALLANILQDPCLGTSAPTLAQQGGVSDVQYATSLGAVDNCLTDYNNGGTLKNGVLTYKFFGTSNNPVNGYPPNPPVSTVGNQWAIGIQTTERNATNSAPYRFIAIDGALPTGVEAYLGHYPLIGEYSFSYQSQSGNVNLALTALVSYSQNPANIALRNGALSNQASFGQAGYVALSGYRIDGNSNTPPTTWSAGNPVTPYTHSASGAPDACSIPIINPLFKTVNLQ